MDLDPNKISPEKPHSVNYRHSLTWEKRIKFSNKLNIKTTTKNNEKIMQNLLGKYSMEQNPSNLTILNISSGMRYWNLENKQFMDGLSNKVNVLHGTQSQNKSNEW